MHEEILRRIEKFVQTRREAFSLTRLAFEDADWLETELRRALARIEKLEAALESFPKLLSRHHEKLPDNTSLWAVGECDEAHTLTLGHLRCAREALAACEGAKDDR